MDFSAIHQAFLKPTNRYTGFWRLVPRKYFSSCTVQTLVWRWARACQILDLVFVLDEIGIPGFAHICAGFPNQPWGRETHLVADGFLAKAAPGWAKRSSMLLFVDDLFLNLGHSMQIHKYLSLSLSPHTYAYNKHADNYTCTDVRIHII